MTDLMNNPTHNGDIMIVDDQPANLKLLEDMLGPLGYAVRSFPRGRLALAAVHQRAPDLILLDITMPEMTGFEVCRQLKSSPELYKIPVIFLSALSDAEDKVNAFRCGGADYITKPFQLEEVQVRVETHIQLQRARRVERDLLEKTIKGVVKAFAELLQLAEPALYLRSQSLRNMVLHIGTRMGVGETRPYEVAATLSLIGSLALRRQGLATARGEEIASEEEDQIFRIGSRLLKNIPHLESVAEMIDRQQSDQTSSPQNDSSALGARMLRLALDLDRRVFSGIPFQVALDQLKTTPGLHPIAMLNTLDDYPDSDRRRVPFGLDGNIHRAAMTP